MADESDLSADGHSDVQDGADLSAQLIPPPQVSYPDKQSLMTAVQAHGKQHGYNVVVKTSSIPTDKKPGRAAKVWLRCDRGGRYRPRNGLTEATRKRKRTSRLIDCPFMVIGNGSSSVWTVEVVEPHHNHGPIMDPPRAAPHHRVKKGQIEAVPYDWPHDAGFSPFTSALLVVDMQRDCKLFPLEAGFWLIRLEFACRVATSITKVMTYLLLSQSFPGSKIFFMHFETQGFLSITLAKVKSLLICICGMLLNTIRSPSGSLHPLFSRKISLKEQCCWPRHWIPGSTRAFTDPW